MTTKQEPDNECWLAMGRYAAWFCGLPFLAAFVAFILGEIGIFTVAPPPPTGREDPVAYFAYVEATGPLRQLGGRLWLLGLLALAPIGFSLRHRFRSGPTSDLMAAAFAGSTVVGVVWTMVYIGGIGAVMHAAATTPVGMFDALMMVELYVWQALDGALLSGTLLLMGIGAVLAGRLAWTTAVFPRGWSVLSLVLGAVLLTGAAGFVLGLQGLLDMAQALGLLVLIPVWAIWLAWTFGRLKNTAGGSRATIEVTERIEGVANATNR